MSFRLFSSSLLRNSAFLFIDTFLVAFFGLIFWVFAARLYSSYDLGLASFLVSLVGFAILFSRFGFEKSLIVFSDEKSPKLIAFSVKISIIASLVVGLFIGMIVAVTQQFNNLFDSNLLLLGSFIIGIIAVSLSSIQEGIFIGKQSTSYILIRNFLSNSIKIALLVIFAVSSIRLGIFLSYLISALSGMLIGLFFQKRLDLLAIKPYFSLDFRDSLDFLSFSFGSYVVTFLSAVPSFIFPLFIVSFLGFEFNAYFAVPWSLANILFLVPSPFFLTILAKHSKHPKTGIYEKETKFTIIISFFLICFCAVGTFLFSDTILTFYGVEYRQNSLDLLRILAISSIFIYFNGLYITRQYIKRTTRFVIINQSSRTLFCLALGIIFIPYFGLFAVGYIWIVSNVLNLVLSILLEVVVTIGNRETKSIEIN